MTSTALQSGGFSATDALRAGVTVLEEARFETASLDARLLLQHVLGVSREELLADRGLEVTPRQYAVYQELITKRADYQPIAQLTGKREFWDLTFKVTEATLDPRPDSETLIEAVLGNFPDRDAALTMLDLGTGSGCLLLTLLKQYKNARGLGVEISEEALVVAQENAVNLDLHTRASFMHSSWADDVEGTFDVVMTNPPYIPTAVIPTLNPEVSCFEPMVALDGGEDGLNCYRTIIAELQRLLTPKGLAVIELGMAQQAAVESIAASHNLRVVAVKDDMAGLPRCVMITLN